MKLVTSTQMRALEERAAAHGVNAGALMENAGLAVAQEVWMQLGSLEDRRIVVLVGPGNNGGDGLVAARHLAEWGAAVRCYALAPRDDDQWRRTVDAEIPCGSVAEDQNFEALDALLQGAEVIVDALLGAGATRPIDGALAEILRRLAAARARAVRPRLIAVDLPTGLHPDSGRCDPLTVTPDETVTFEFPKVGLYTQPGAARAGSVQTVEIGIPAGLADDVRTELLDRRGAKALLPARPADAHKGSFGKVLVVAGSARYPGAAILAASAAYRTGAGLVTLATAQSLIPSLVAAMPEVTYLPLPDRHGPGILDADVLADLHAALPAYDALVIGCGLGREPATVALVRRLLHDDAARGLKAIILDADGANAVAGTDWAATAAAPVIVTPHPGEMAGLMGGAIDAVQAERLELSLRQAAAWNCLVVLKGANTVIAAPDGRARISGVAHAALATAGTGDVLAGAIGGLVAQGLPLFDAACLGVYLHGNAGERAARAVGTMGATARDVLEHLALAGRGLAGEEPLETPGLGGGLFGGGLAGRMGGGPGDAGLGGFPADMGGLGGPGDMGAGLPGGLPPGFPDLGGP